MIIFFIDFNFIRMDFSAAVAKVLKDARLNWCLARGLREVCKAIEKGREHTAFVILADNCDDDKYTKCVEALCKDQGVPCISVSDGKKLGEWCGLVRMDNSGEQPKIAKVVKTSSCAVIAAGLPDSVKNGQAFQMVMENAKSD